MSKLAFALVVALALSTTPALEAQLGFRPSSTVPILDCRYGLPVRFDAGILRYPDFTVRFKTRTEFTRDSNRQPWITLVFEVLDNERRTIGGDITFNSEWRANGRRFDVLGKIYIAEMYYSTADLAESEQPSLKSRLDGNEIVIWNESAAADRNPRLLRVWNEEKVDPAARYSVSNAYTAGILLPGFGPAAGKIDYGENALATGSLKVEKVALAKDDALAPIAETSECHYGNRVFFHRGLLRYPDFSVLLTSREEANSIDVRTSSVAYEFVVFDLDRKCTGFRFTTYDLANGFRFECGETTYFAEMYSTTAMSKANQSLGAVNIPLGDRELIIWNEESARAGNPRILSAWNPSVAEQKQRRAGKFAGGVPLTISMFTGTYLLGNSNEWCEYSKLDAPLIVDRAVKIDYPKALAGTGFIGHVSGFFYVKPDGSVDGAVTGSGNEPMFQEPSRAAIAQLRFSSPKKDHKPVRTLVNFTWDIREPNLDTSDVVFN